MLQSQYCFYQSRDTGGDIQMANICFYGADSTEGLFVGGFPESLSQRLDLNWITQGGAGAMGLDITDTFRFNIADRLGHGDYFGLSIYTGSSKTDFQRPIVIDCRTRYNSLDRITVRQRFGESFQHHNADSLAKHCALSLGVKGSTVAVR